MLKHQQQQQVDRMLDLFALVVEAAASGIAKGGLRLPEADVARDQLHPADVPSLPQTFVVNRK